MTRTNPNATAFCHWLEGVLVMAKDESGGATLTKTQLTEIERKLTEALGSPAPAQSGGSSNGPLARC